jgi:hypothetical protein
VSDRAPRWLSRHRRAVRYLSAAGVVAAAVSVPLATLSSAATVTAGSAIPAAAAHQLSTMMLREATMSGDAKPAWITAVTTTHAKALEVATPGDTIPGSAGQTVYLAVMKGNFTLNDAAVPPGGDAPTGHYLAITFDAATLHTLDVGLSDQAPPVSLNSLGPVSTLAQPK